jgi:hypothetical protein
VLDAHGALPISLRRSIALRPHEVGLPHERDAGTLRIGGEPSWVYHVLGWPCDPDDDEDTG